jgi:hypothetical protein
MRTQMWLKNNQKQHASSPVLRRESNRTPRQDYPMHVFKWQPIDGSDKQLAVKKSSPGWNLGKVLEAAASSTCKDSRSIQRPRSAVVSAISTFRL